MRKCKCDRCVIGQPWTQDQCYFCWTYHNRPEYKALWDGDTRTLAAINTTNETRLAEARARMEKLLECPHRGKATGILHTCKTCGGNVQVKEFACDLHTLCVLEKEITGIACCKNCPDKPESK